MMFRIRTCFFEIRIDLFGEVRENILYNKKLESIVRENKVNKTNNWSSPSPSVPLPQAGEGCLYWINVPFVFDSD